MADAKKKALSSFFAKGKAAGKALDAKMKADDSVASTSASSSLPPASDVAILNTLAPSSKTASSTTSVTGTSTDSSWVEIIEPDVVQLPRASALLSTKIVADLTDEDLDGENVNKADLDADEARKLFHSTILKNKKSAGANAGTSSTAASGKPVAPMLATGWRAKRDALGLGSSGGGKVDVNNTYMFPSLSGSSGVSGDAAGSHGAKQSAWGTLPPGVEEEVAAYEAEIRMKELNVQSTDAAAADSTSTPAANIAASSSTNTTPAADQSGKKALETPEEVKKAAKSAIEVSNMVHLVSLTHSFSARTRIFNVSAFMRMQYQFQRV
jgi:hypothetical protein